MSTMTETLKQEALFIPSEETRNGHRETTGKNERVPGEYLGHITEVRITEGSLFDERDRSGKLTGRKVKAVWHNFNVLVAPENATQTYTRRDHEGNEHTHTGEDYVGWAIQAHGVPRFLEPTDDDSFHSNATGNFNYMKLCETLGVRGEIVERDLKGDGKMTKLESLPILTEKDLTGVPVTAVVDRGKDYMKDGVSHIKYVAKFVRAWENGTRLTTTTTTTDDLPF